jgi:hypothetical protein
MPRSRFALCHALALAPLGTLALLCLAACTPAARGPAATATPTSHVMPAHVPSGWQVLATPHFGLAYPPDWTLAVDTLTGTAQYYIKSPDHQVRLDVSASPSLDPPNVAYAQLCHPTPTPVETPNTQQFHPTTLAGLPMQYQLVPYAYGMMRSWEFWNAQYTIFYLSAYDGDASAAIQAQNEAILATFRPDDVTPLQC